MGKALFFSRSKAVSLAITLREDGEGVKPRFHKPEGIFSHRCRRHRYASRCFLGFSLYQNVQCFFLVSLSSAKKDEHMIKKNRKNNNFLIFL